MLTEQELLQMKRKILSARSYLMREHPLFGVLLMYMKFVAVEDMEQISTNGSSIFFSPKWMNWYSITELSCLLCHQVMHILMGDMGRPLALMGDAYHYLRDAKVNKALKNSGVVSSYVHLRQNSQKRMMADTDKFWSDRTDYAENGVLILDTAADIQKSLHANGFAAIAGFAESVDLQNDFGASGKETLAEKQCWKNEDDGALDWRKLLNDFVQEEIFDYSFCPPDRRLEETGFFLPAFNDKEFVTKNLLFMVDTSGSMLIKDVLKEVYTEIKNAIQQFNEKIEGMVGFFDSEVMEPQPFASIDDFDGIEVYGGGGTDFGIIFDYIRKNNADVLPSCLIIFTDGRAEYPEESETLDIPVLWVMTEPDANPPFGKVARICKEKE